MTQTAGDPSIEPELLAAAIEVQAQAYAPYSRFLVGAAIRTRSGRVFSGCNVENAAYPQGTCAEAGAIAAMVAAGERAIDVIVTVCDGEMLSTPCGGCRQKIREFADARTVIHAAGPHGVRVSYTMGELLPDGFGPENLA
jgi:cytidine deaminase